MANILMNYVMVFRKASPYSLYILLMLLIAYMFNQLDRYTLSITSMQTAQSLKYGDRSCLKFNNVTKEQGAGCKNQTESTCDSFMINTTNGTEMRVCKYDYNGQGIEYQIVAGPAFILVFTVMAILLSLFADRYVNKRVLILTVCLIWWSSMTALTGLVTSYWQLLLLRFGLGIGEAGCNPIATSLIADYFSIELRGAALGIYNWGIYTGYSLSFAIGNQIIKYLSWRWVYIICGLPGILVAILIFITVRQPKKEESDIQPLNVQQEASTEKFKKVIVEFFKPSLILLCLAGSIRNAAGYVWGYNNNTYYKQLGQSEDQISAYLGTIPLVFGIIGSFVGGFVSDRVAKQAKPWIRIWVLVISQIVAAPFVFGVLFFDPPVSYYFLIPSYIFGEMWVGVCLSVVVELVPERLRTTGVGFYFFLIGNIGGNMQTLVPPVQRLLGKMFKISPDQQLKAALYLFYPGEYIIGSALFLLTLFVLKRDLKRLEESSEIRSLTNLIDDDEANNED